jgi:glycosyltransferase involved in cell wall biosynthesis
MRIGIDALGLQHPCATSALTGYVDNLLDSLFRYDKDNDYVVFYHDSYPRMKARWVARASARTGRPGSWAVAQTSSTLDLVDKHVDDFDVLMLTLPFSSCHLPRNPRRRAKLTSIVYDLAPFQLLELHPIDVEAADHDYESLHTLQRYDELLAVSEATKKDCEALLGLMPGRVCVLGCASRDDVFAPCSDPDGELLDQKLLRDAGVSSRFLLTVATSACHTNLDRLVLAYGRLPRPLREAHQLVISGALDERAAGWLKMVADESGSRSRLIFAGPLPDETMRALYRNASLCILPSENSAFDLSTLEGLMCGAPLIVGDRSLQTELVGTACPIVNGADPTSLGAKMQEALASPELQADLRQRGIEQAQRFRSETMAARTVAAFARLASTERAPSASRAPQPKARPRLAFFSPLPPKATGIADYAVDLLQELKSHFRIDLYHDSGWVPHLAFADHEFRAYTCRLFRARAAALDYRGALYQMGNHARYHQFVYDALNDFPGVITLHDFFLGEFHFGSARSRRGLVQLADELRFCYAPAISDELLDGLDLSEGPRTFVDRLRQRSLYMNHRIFERASHVVVHSHWCVDAAARIDAKWPARITVVPSGARAYGPLPPAERDAVRRRHGLPADALLVGSFGIVAPSKMNQEAVLAFQELAKADPTALFVFVGPTFVDLNSWAASRGLAERIRVLGQTSIDEFRALARAIDIGVNLRRPPTFGETSGALMSLLSAGVPTLVTDIDACSDYPDDMVVKVAWGDDFVERLAKEMLNLARDHRRREEISRAALRHVHSTHDWARVAEQYAEIIERQAGSARALVRTA